MDKDILTEPQPDSATKVLHRHYLIKWKVVLSLQINGVERNFHGWFGDISTTHATAYLENNLPVNAHLMVYFQIPPKSIHDQARVIQANGQSTFCVLANNGMFRAGIKFNNFQANGLSELEKELATHIPAQV